MSVAKLFIGFIFLINPCYSIIDIIPDFIGYILIILFFSKWRDINSRFETSRRFFVYLTGASVIKLASLLLTINLPDKGMLLVLSFVFFIIETILMLVAFNELFEGFMVSSTLFDSSYVIGEISQARIITIIFIIAHNVFNLLPELSYLYVDEYEGYVLLNYKDAISLITMFISLVIGIIWYISMNKFKKAFFKDSLYLEKIEYEYNTKIIVNAKRFLVRRIKVYHKLLSLSLIFLVDFYVDGYDALPNLVTAILLISALLYAKDYLVNNKLLIVSIVLLTTTSIIKVLYCIFAYNVDLSSDEIYMIPSYYLLLTIIIGVVSLASLIVFLLAILKENNHIIKNHMGKDNPDGFASVENKNRINRRNMYLFEALFVFLAIVNNVLGSLEMYGYYWDKFSTSYSWFFNLNLLTGAALFIIGNIMFSTISYKMEEKYLSW